MKHFVLQQDRDPKHCATIIESWFVEKQIQRLYWVAGDIRKGSLGIVMSCTFFLTETFHNAFGTDKEGLSKGFVKANIVFALLESTFECS